jgi:hypothetical protein
MKPSRWGQMKTAIAIQAVAAAHRRSLAVSYLPQANSGHTRKEIDDYYDEVAETAETAARTGRMAVAGDGFITAQIYDADRPQVSLIPFTDTIGNAFLGAQLEAGLAGPLTKKSGGPDESGQGRRLPGRPSP